MNQLPERLIFESRQDVIDYITYGIVPNRTNAENVIQELRNPGTTRCQINFIPENHDESEFADIMAQVYENVALMQKLHAAITVIGTIGGFLVGKRCGR